MDRFDYWNTLSDEERAAYRHAFQYEPASEGWADVQQYAYILAGF